MFCFTKKKKKNLPKLVERCVPSIQGFLCGVAIFLGQDMCAEDRVGCYPEFYCIVSKLSYVNNLFILLLSPLKLKILLSFKRGSL